ncbi:geranylgeranyl diphosphate synthase type I [Kineococcus xinjiangensis]|uniref:Geranylgeranyl diphosphate synthase type I n=1 Tax=Kineococcus xinjiangensis TaxID=512762 RepID=A0A2S6IM10_9ACTN|nr:polyprenyl synthetase family protein [Kineococcus xinjiangensis]PPK95272.1 geranylgeranyl diphosphate synthase type I [Kineococcus xinjiangensis]
MAPTSTASPASAAVRLPSRVQAALDDFLAAQAQVLAEVAPECADLLDGIRDLLRGGKRLRPAFCYWGYRGAGGADGDGIVDVGAALELFQAAALIHDDLMDDSDTRRGLPSSHRRFAALHSGSGWSGGAERFGLAGAVLSGDLCLGWSDELFSTARLPAEAIARARSVFSLMRTQLMGGQYLDVLEQASAAGADPAGAVERARRVVRFKSAKYSMEHPLLLGGRLAGAGEELLASYSTIGLALGEAFQLRDDVLGTFGDPGVTGKPAGDDLREGKRTVLVALALQEATPSQAAVVDELLGDPDLDRDGVERLRGVLVDTGAAADVERRIEALVQEACDALEAADVDDTTRTALHELLVAATARQS